MSLPVPYPFGTLNFLWKHPFVFPCPLRRRVSFSGTDYESEGRKFESSRARLSLCYEGRNVAHSAHGLYWLSCIFIRRPQHLGVRDWSWGHEPSLVPRRAGDVRIAPGKTRSSAASISYRVAPSRSGAMAAIFPSATARSVPDGPSAVRSAAPDDQVVVAHGLIS